MENLFGLLVLASLVLLIIGLFKPTTSLFWDKRERTRKKSVIVYGGLAILFFILFGVTTDRTKAKVASDKEQQSTTTSTQSERLQPGAQSEETTNQNLFDNPQSLTNTLSQNGIGELKPWNNPMEMGWGSLTDYFQFGNKKNGVGMQNNIAYYLEGDEQSAKTLTINLNVNNPADKESALKFLNEIAIKTFNSLNLEVPNGLTNSILTPKTFKADIDGFATSVELDKSKIETWKVNIVRK